MALLLYLDAGNQLTYFITMLQFQVGAGLSQMEFFAEDEEVTIIPDFSVSTNGASILGIHVRSKLLS